MENTQMTKTCSNCRETIEASKIMLHEPFCCRNFKYCEECKIVVEIAEFDEHLNSHKKTNISENISKENKSNNSNNVKNDISNTNSNLNLKKTQSVRVNCPFCELELSMEEMYDHEVMCGARSTTCEFCDKKLLTSQLKKHLDTCTARIALEQYEHLEDEYHEGI